MVAPLGEDALDFLDAVPGAKQLIKDMVAAAVEHSEVHMNSFRYQNMGHGEFEYYLGKRGGRTSPFVNNRRLSANIIDLLLYHGIAERTREPNQADGWYGFTDVIIKWHKEHGGPSPDQIRKKIGRHLYGKRDVEGFTPIVQVEEIAAALNLPPRKVNDQIQILLKQNLLKSELRGTGMGYGILSFTPAGEMWAESEFRPIYERTSPTINVNLGLELNLQIQNMIYQAQENRVEPAKIEELKVLLENLKGELEKPAGKGSRRPFRDLLSFLGDTSGVASVVLPFLYDHRDKLDMLSDAVQGMI